MSLVDDTIRELRSKEASLRCSELKTLLESLGFSVEDGSSGNHKTIDHDGIPDFVGGHYDCGHGKNPQIKPCYVREMRKLIEKYKDYLMIHLGEKDV